MPATYNPKRIRLTRPVPTFSGDAPAGTVFTIVCVSAIATSGPFKGRDIHGLSPDAFEFIHDGSGGKQEAAMLPTLVAAEPSSAEPDEIELPSFV